MPKEPQYKAKHSKITFEISKQRFNNDGTVLLIGSKHKLYKDYAKKELIKQKEEEKRSIQGKILKLQQELDNL